MINKITTLVVSAALTLIVAVTAHASVLPLNVTGSLDGATVLTTSGGGTAALGADTPFSYHAIFDSTAGTEIFSGYGLYAYPAVTTFVLTGQGTYTSSSLFVILADPTSIFAHYAAGILSDLSNTLVTQYSTASPPFSASNPIPSTLSGVGSHAFNGALTFDGGVTLSNLTNGVETTTSALTPEPSTYVLLTIALGAVGFVRRKMNRQM